MQDYKEFLKLFIDLAKDSLKDILESEQAKDYSYFLGIALTIIAIILLICKLVEIIMFEKTKDKYTESEYIPKCIRIRCPHCKNRMWALQDATMICEYCQSELKIGKYCEGIDDI